MSIAIFSHVEVQYICQLYLLAAPLWTRFRFLLPELIMIWPTSTQIMAWCSLFEIWTLFAWNIRDHKYLNRLMNNIQRYFKVDILISHHITVYMKQDSLLRFLKLTDGRWIIYLFLCFCINNLNWNIFYLIINRKLQNYNYPGKCVKFSSVTICVKISKMKIKFL